VARQWSLIRQPSASSATLSSSTARNPTFTPNVPDLHVFRLWATNAAGAFCIRTVSLTATAQPIILPDSLGRTNAQFSFTLLSQPGSAIEVQTSADLLAWATLSTLTNLTGTLPFTDTAAAAGPRFYRVQHLP
jgi:hypothetical protein